MKQTNITWSEAEKLLDRHFQVYDKKNFTRKDTTNRHGVRYMEICILSRLGDVLQVIVKDNQVISCTNIHETPNVHRYLGFTEINTIDELKQALSYTA